MILAFDNNLDTILESKPPRPDNLARDYSIYVNIHSGVELKAARYEIKILNLEAVPTIESEKAVWTRIVTRYAYKEDFNIAPIAEQTLSEFAQVAGEAQQILKTLEKAYLRQTPIWDYLVEMYVTLTIYLSED